MPPMQHHQHVDNLAACYRRQKEHSNAYAANQNNKKRKRAELEREEQDMDVEEDGGKKALLELGSAESSLKLETVKKTRYEYTYEDGIQGDSTGYSPSHPGVQYGSEEIELLKLHRKHSGSNSMPHILAQEHRELSSSTNNSQPKKIKSRTTRKSIEEGEVISDDDDDDDDEEEEESSAEDTEDDFPDATLGWWLKEPLVPVSTKQPKLSPPPVPRVKLPLEALSRFYTKSTVLQKMSFEDRIMWLDPLYGNLQPVSGRYDRLRKLLESKSAKK